MSSVSSNAEGPAPTDSADGIPRACGHASLLVVHVHGEPSGGPPIAQPTQEDGVADRISALLESASLHAVVCSNVYQALARLLESGAQTPGAMLVCVDALGQPELEFFSIVARLRPSLPVYVYGESRSASRIARAIEFGAAGRVTEEIVRALADTTIRADSAVHETETETARTTADQPTPAGAPTTDQAAADRIEVTTDAPPAAATEPTGSPAVEWSPPSPRVAAHEDNEPAYEKTDEEISEAPARVPWLRHHDRPLRVAPQSRTRPPDQSEASGRRTSKPPEQEPLLTDEELQALLGGDDIAAIAPEQRDAVAPDEQPGGSAGR